MVTVNKEANDVVRQEIGSRIQNAFGVNDADKLFVKINRHDDSGRLFRYLGTNVISKFANRPNQGFVFKRSREINIIINLDNSGTPINYVFYRGNHTKFTRAFGDGTLKPELGKVYTFDDPKPETGYQIIRILEAEGFM